MVVGRHQRHVKCLCRGCNEMICRISMSKGIPDKAKVTSNVSGASEICNSSIECAAHVATSGSTLNRFFRHRSLSSQILTGDSQSSLFGSEMIFRTRELSRAGSTLLHTRCAYPAGTSFGPGVPISEPSGRTKDVL